MLASLTPLGERGRHNIYPVTIAAFLVGGLLAAASLGALLGALGSLTLEGLSAGARLAVLVPALLAALVIDLGARRVPGPRRQVDERWRDEFRGWIYGAGYGAQMGLAVVTVVTSAATYVALIAALLAADPLTGAVIVGCYGVIRGLTPLLGAGARTPAQLLRVHRSLATAEPWARRGGYVLIAAAALTALAGSLA